MTMSEPTPPTVDRIVTGGAPTIFVSDLDRAVTFYTTTLGLDLEYRAGNDFAMIDAGQGFKIGLHPPSQQGPVPGTHGAISVGLTVSEPIERVMETLRQRGVTFRGPIVDDGSVRLAFFGDPDGNDLYLCEVGSG
jgi:catechol 2,3-dioxygenase-like lactoylglutathione lyase family enzyme